MSKARLVITAVVVEGRSQAEVAKAYGVSKGWVSKLVARYRNEGATAFEPRSRRPRRSPTATSPDTVELIVRLRKELLEQGLDAGADTIMWHLEHRHGVRASRATVHRQLVHASWSFLHVVVHYLVADHEHTFVSEREAHNAEHTVDADDARLCVTNYMLHRCKAPRVVPDVATSDPADANMYERARILHKLLDAEAVGDDTLWDALEAVRFDGQSQGDWCKPGEQTWTLWHAQYDINTHHVVLRVLPRGQRQQVAAPSPAPPR